MRPTIKLHSTCSPTLKLMCTSNPVLFKLISNLQNKVSASSLSGRQESSFPLCHLAAIHISQQRIAPQRR